MAAIVSHLSKGILGLELASIGILGDLHVDNYQE